MPHAHAFTTGSDQSAQAQKKTTKHITNAMEDDLSLLGYSQRQSIDAVSIAKPGSTRPSYKPSGGGPQPMNTLTTSHILPEQSPPTRPPVLAGSRRVLAVDVSRGYNVPKIRGEEIADSFEAPPSAKRQKLVQRASSSSDSPESVDDMPAHQVTFGRRPTKTQSASLRSQGIGNQSGVQQRIGMSDEYRGVEGMMDSNPRNAKRNNREGTKKSVSPLMEALSRSNSLEMVGEDVPKAAPIASSIRKPYTGTLRKQQEPTHTDVFKDSDRKAQAEQTHSEYFRPNPKLPILPPDANQELRTKFKGTNGKFRGAEYLSSDELDGPPTIGEHADVVPLSPRRRNQPASSKSSTSTVQSARPPMEEQPMERSNIKSTIFHTQAPSKGKPSRETDFEEAYLDGKESSRWAIAVTAVNLPGQRLMYESPLMYIVSDEEKKRFFIELAGQPLRASNNLILSVYPGSLQRCLREKSGRKMRFESSKRGTEDHVLDLELSSEKDAVNLINKIQESSTNVRVIDMDSARMQKMFEVRRNQPRPTPAPFEGFDDMPEDVQMAARNRQRQEAKDRAIQETSNIKRRHTMLANGLTDSTLHENAQVGFISNSCPSAEPNGLPNRTTINSKIGATNRSSIFEKTRPPHNDHLRRSTRTSGTPARFLDEPEEPKVEKYSVKVGLCNKWSKPLSYPKMGKKKATVEWEDLERLDEGEFLNDNLVSFYMRYLEEEITKTKPEIARTVYFFNSFFYDRLTTTKKGQKGINYEGVQRWTRGVSLFAYEYVVVPINELTHWYVAIICNLPALDRNVSLSDEPSSPVDAANEQLAQELKDSLVEEDAPEPEEKEARQSFAEMSLDGKPHKRQLSEDSLMGQLERPKENRDPATRGEDDEMLDAPDITDEAVGLEDSKHKQEVDDLIEDQDEAPKSFNLPPKKRRKSIPPSITKVDPSRPAIITFDSFGHSHSNVIRVLKQYLYEEGKAKRSTEFDVGYIRGITAKSIPQQSNFSDCGLFMLGYVEKFLEDNPRDFIAKIIRRDYDDRKDWPKMVPSIMRRSLREQLQRLHEEEVDERRANAAKAGNYQAGSGDAKAGFPNLKEAPKLNRETASRKLSNPSGDKPLDTKKPALQDTPPADIQKIQNARYNPTEATEAPPPNLPLKPNLPSKARDTKINDNLPDASLIPIEGQTQPEVARKEEQSDIPCSQPPQPPTPDHSMPGSFPTLPNEIEDSQPSQLRVAELRVPPLQTKTNTNGEESRKAPEDLALWPEVPSEQQKQMEGGEDEKETEEKHPEQPERLNMRYTNWFPRKEEEIHSAPALPQRTRRKGTAQRVQASTQRQQQQRVGEKMTKEEAIVLDD